MKLYLTILFLVVEHRGLWLRPKEQTVEQVREHLTAIKALNINAVYLETWWDGYTAFPTDNPLTGLNPIYNGFDVLGAYIEKKVEVGGETDVKSIIALSNENDIIYEKNLQNN
ncbi:hypothetical protein IJ21_33910 [Paenibacillus sp. 32O-W]|uniref:hypothetical protein n=1 Tax=Paenibacillus sp. 32O-W TaxID=1695218 RepID=UPI00072060A6|nr:hypothetical protein [Paenibacillus sp. 32O-W]ALS28780.1 hypothetical protein IJ21_33910 [Paenibacillus sp. 32O-W]